MKTLLILILLAAPPTLAQLENYFDRWHPDGRYWAKLTNEGKAAYLQAFWDGIQIMGVATVAQFGQDDNAAGKVLDASAEYNPNEVKWGEITDDLNSFFSETVNKNVPISWAYWYVLQRRARGESQELKDALMKVRNHYRMVKPR